MSMVNPIVAYAALAVIFGVLATCDTPGVGWVVLAFVTAALLLLLL